MFKKLNNEYSDLQEINFESILSIVFASHSKESTPSDQNSDVEITSYVVAEKPDSKILMYFSIDQPDSHTDSPS